MCWIIGLDFSVRKSVRWPQFFEGGPWSGRDRCDEHPFSVVRILLAHLWVERWKGCANVSDCCDSPSTRLPQYHQLTLSLFAMCLILLFQLGNKCDILSSVLEPFHLSTDKHERVLRSLLWWYVAYCILYGIMRMYLIFFKTSILVVLFFYKFSCKI